jgi:hypothetical protein
VKKEVKKTKPIKKQKLAGEKKVEKVEKVEKKSCGCQSCSSASVNKKFKKN